MGALMIIQENVCALLFVTAVIQSCRNAMKPSVPMLGEFPNEACEDTYDDQILMYVRSHFHFTEDAFHQESEESQDYSRLISPFRFIMYCTYESDTAPWEKKCRC